MARGSLLEKRLTPAILFWGAFLLFFGFALAVYLAPFMIYPWDVWITNTLQLLPQVVTEPLMRFVSALGYFFYPTLLGVVLLAAWLVRQKKAEHAMWLTLSSLWSILASNVIKPSLHRPRPSGSLVHLFLKERGFGFPSGHVLTYVTIYGCIALLLRDSPSLLAKLTRRFCIFLVLLVGISRIYLGAHWTSDVLASYGLGVALLSGVYWLLQKNNPDFRI
jgi:undecaprenyl-diphosphatase